MNGYCLTEEIELADEEEQDLKTLLEDKKGMTLHITDVSYTGIETITKQEKHIFNQRESK